MGLVTGIAWTDSTWNPYRGCSKVSPGCAHCYAEAGSLRNPGLLGVWGPRGTRVCASPHSWRQPPLWDRAAAEAGRRHKVFCASFADVFEDWPGQPNDHKGRPLWYAGPGLLDPDPRQAIRPATLDDLRDRLHALIGLTQNLDWLLLTKRLEGAIRYYASDGLYDRVRAHADHYLRRHDARLRDAPLWHPDVQRNRWVGASVESQRYADERIPLLLKVPAALHFLSCEPLLGPIVLPLRVCQKCGEHSPDGPRCGRCGQYAMAMPGKIRWVIAGGESGAKARPCDLDWLASLRDQCAAAGVPYFLKQWGRRPVAPRSMVFDLLASVECEAPSRTEDVWKVFPKDKKGSDPGEWPADFRVQQFPTSPAGIPAAAV